MFGVTKSIQERATIGKMLQDVAYIIPSGWHYPEITRGKLRFAGQEFVSEPFQETPWKLASDIVVGDEIVGTIEVYYIEEREILDEGPFMAEERRLLDGIALTVSNEIRRQHAEGELRIAARTDELTGLPNRALLNDRLQQAVLRSLLLPIENSVNFNLQDIVVQ